MTTKQPAQRLSTLDALRGLAAVLVVFYHAKFPGHSEKLLAWLPGALAWPFHHGALGVPMFFAISGFVIPLSVDKYRIDGRFIRRFALKRSLRLDPVYWVVIALTMGPTIILQITNLRPNPNRATVSIGEFFSNMFYLQGIRNVSQYVTPAWTLCLEVQFYLLYVGVLWLVTKAASSRFPALARITERREQTFLIICVVMSTTILFKVSTFPVSWVPIWLPQFGPGLAAFIVYKSIRESRQLPPTVWALVLATTAIPFITGLRLNYEAYTTSGLVGFLLLLCVLTGRLNLGSSSRVVRYFGSRSYSLYLMHGLAMAKAMPLVSKLDSGTVATQFLVFLVSFAVAVASGELLYRLVEQPALSLSRQISYDGTARQAFAAVRFPWARRRPLQRSAE